MVVYEKWFQIGDNVWLLRSEDGRLWESHLTPYKQIPFVILKDGVFQPEPKFVSCKREY
jgi:hypothetical protein